jgi:hypothetical protein
MQVKCVSFPHHILDDLLSLTLCREGEGGVDRREKGEGRREEEL